MNKNLKVVLADTDALYLQKLKRCLERKGDITIVGMSDTGCEAIELVQMHQADMLITDIILRESDGFWAMKALRKLESECMCIVISALDNDKVVREATSLGAEYYMAKPIQGDLLLERIYHLAEMDHMELPAFIRAMPEEVFHHKEVDTLSLEAEISGVLSRMGISASIKGYHFIRRAIMMAVEDSEVLIGITKGLYPDLAKSYKTSASKVERAIRHAIESAWKKNGSQVYFELAGYMQYDKPTNGQFIAVMAEHFRLGGTKGTRSA